MSYRMAVQHFVMFVHSFFEIEWVIKQAHRENPFQYEILILPRLFSLLKIQIIQYIFAHTQTQCRTAYYLNRTNSFQITNLLTISEKNTYMYVYILCTHLNDRYTCKWETFVIQKQVIRMHEFDYLCQLIEPSRE